MIRRLYNCLMSYDYRRTQRCKTKRLEVWLAVLATNESHARKLVESGLGWDKEQCNNFRCDICLWVPEGFMAQSLPTPVKMF